MRNNIGEAGEPCGIPVWIHRWVSVLPSNDSPVVLSLRKEEHQDMTAAGQPSVCIVASKRVEETLSKAPLTSKNRADVVKRFPAFACTSCISAIAASIAERLGRPPIWSAWRMLCDSAIRLSMVAMSFSNTLPMQLSKAIGRYAFTAL
jgi:hypothetical protein